MAADDGCGYGGAAVGVRGRCCGLLADPAVSAEGRRAGVDMVVVRLALTCVGRGADEEAEPGFSWDVGGVVFV